MATATRQTPRPPYLEIPKVGGLVVTGNLTGGSFIVTEMKDRYRIFHDPRRNSSIYYDNIVMAVDFLNIAGSEGVTATANVFTQFISSNWTLFLQLQEMNSHLVLRKMPEGESAVFSRRPGSYNRQVTMKAIDQYRERYPCLPTNLK